MSGQSFSIPAWVNWIAQDANGNWWGYSAEPHQHEWGWYENEVGDCQLLATDQANSNWRETLQRIMH
ncbi:hypothetical protein [Thiohalophilus sp.]|uniref:hypothetical protein n=1 Tax=Thiohalophilus sp. TaxID=3028392 RepID=UPI003975A758